MPKDRGYLRQFGSVEDLMGLSVDTQMEITQPLRRQVDVSAAGRLRLTTDSIYRLGFRRLHEGIPFCQTHVSLPPEVGQHLDLVPELHSAGSVSNVTVIGLLDSRLVSPIAEARQSITVALADGPTAKQLDCPEEHPLLQIDRLYLDTSEQPVELAVSFFVPEQYSYRMSLRRSVG